MLGICITSGLAKGIDVTAYQATLKAKENTIAILSTGIDEIAYNTAIPYPSLTKKLLTLELKELITSIQGGYIKK